MNLQLVLKKEITDIKLIPGQSFAVLPIISRLDLQLYIIIVNSTYFRIVVNPLETSKYKSFRCDLSISGSSDSSYIYSFELTDALKVSTISKYILSF